jgi:DnaJ-class molecular chaperone
MVDLVGHAAHAGQLANVVLGGDSLEEPVHVSARGDPAVLNQHIHRIIGDEHVPIEDLEQFLARALAGGGQRSQGTFRARGQDVSYVLPVAFLDAANGAARTVTLPDSKTLQVTLPEGVEDRQKLRLKEQSMSGFGDGLPGGAYVE